jgi:hypothetical protein
MANGGWYGTAEEWARIERPLLEIDPILDEFAVEYDLTKFKNEKAWPSRSFVWGEDVRCLIQLYLVDKHKLTLNLWLCASKDQGTKRFWKQEMLIREQRVNQFENSLATDLREGYRKLVAWSGDPSVLQFATRIYPHL